MTRLRILLLALLLGAALWPSAADAAIRVGVARPAEGQGASAGRDILQAVKLAATRINAEGGVLGQPLEVVEAEDGCAAAGGAEAAKGLIAQSVALVVGHPCAAAAIAAANLYAQAGVVFIAPATRYPGLTAPRAGPTIFRLAGRDDQQGASAGAYMAATFAGRPVAIVHDGSLYATKLGDGAMAALKAAGRGDVAVFAVAGGQKDFAPLVAKLAAGKIAAIFFAGFPIEGGSLLRQMRAAGLATAFLGSDSLATPQLAETADDATEGAAALLPYDAARALPGAKAHAAFPGSTPTGPFVSAYAAIEAWRAGVRTANTLDGAAVAGALQQGTSDTVLGKVSFDAAGNADVPSYGIVRWRDGAWRPED